MDGRRTERREAPGNRIRLIGQLVRLRLVSCRDITQLVLGHVGGNGLEHLRRHRRAGVVTVA
jgi:hypothetical protein